MKRTSFGLMGAFFIAGIAISAPAMAETPDGTTPANETVCDGLKTNATPGLYGLCVAYCEAQDLDIVGDKETPDRFTHPIGRFGIAPGFARCASPHAAFHA